MIQQKKKQMWQNVKNWWIHTKSIWVFIVFFHHLCRFVVLQHNKNWGKKKTRKNSKWENGSWFNSPGLNIWLPLTRQEAAKNKLMSTLMSTLLARCPAWGGPQVSDQWTVDTWMRFQLQHISHGSLTSPLSPCEAVTPAALWDLCTY